MAVVSVWSLADAAFLTASGRCARAAISRTATELEASRYTAENSTTKTSHCGTLLQVSRPLASHVVVVLWHFEANISNYCSLKIKAVWLQLSNVLGIS